MTVLNRFFSQGFRPFFLSAGVWAVLSMLLWVLTVGGHLGDGELALSADWHIHEMIYGYIAAVIAGFLLTAVPNWTGVAAPKGWKLAGLFVVWLLGRLCYFYLDALPTLLVAFIDVVFLVLFATYLVRALSASGNKRNFVVAALISGLILANILTYIEALQALGNRLALSLVLLLISLIGGRIIPNFTRNYLVSNGSQKIPGEFGLPDKLALLTTGLALTTYVFDVQGWFAGVAFLAAGLCGAWRLVRWSGTAASDEALVWVLHLAYLWFPVGYCLMALHYFGSGLELQNALHALTSGAVVTMTVAVMTRATLGHSGRALTAGAGTTVLYVLISLAALLRVSAGVAIEPQAAYALAGLVWCLAFCLYLALYGPLFFKPRVG